MLIFAVGWQLTAGRPAGTGQALLLAAAALAMGLQSGAVVTIGIAGLSTTYLTGTLTSLLTTAAHSSRIKTEALFIVGALLAGAAAAALAINNLPRLAPAVPLCAVAVVAGLALRAPQLGTDQD